MGKKNARRRKCENKVRYGTMEGAAAGIDRLREVKKVTELLTPYKCGFCQGWHFGHPPARVLKRIRTQLLAKAA
jgi:hypothetical protein